jgi:hypothetical protein
MDWGQNGYAYLDAINYVESTVGTNLSTSSKGATGWIQFEPSTPVTYGCRCLSRAVNQTRMTNERIA